MREHHKFLAVRVLWEVKQVLKATAELLVSQGKLRQPDDIWVPGVARSVRHLG